MVLAVLTVPRFVVAETGGYTTGGYSRARLGLAALVLDRWYCHRVVASYRSEARAPDHQGVLGDHRARRLADTHAERLNRG